MELAVSLGLVVFAGAVVALVRWAGRNERRPQLYGSEPPSGD